MPSEDEYSEAEESISEEEEEETGVKSGDLSEEEEEQVDSDEVPCQHALLETGQVGVYDVSDTSGGNPAAPR